MKLVGPKEVNEVFAVDGGLLKLKDGVGTFHPDGAADGNEDIPVELIPQNVFGLGFHQPEAAASAADEQ